MTSHALYWWHHMHYISHVIYFVWYHIYYMCDITQWMYLWHHTLCLTYPLYMASHIVLWQHNHCVTSQPLCLTLHPLCLCCHTPWITFIKPSVCMTSQPLCVWHHIHYMWHHIHNLGHHTILCMISSPLYLTLLWLYLCHQTHHINDITATICMNTYPTDLWHHINYIYDIITTKYDITTLCVDDATLGICMISIALQMTMHPLYHTKPQYLWFHIHFKQNNIVPVSDIAPTVSMSSHCLHWHLTHFCMTPHPESVWHHINYI